jgi:hypothetical protein
MKPSRPPSYPKSTPTTSSQKQFIIRSKPSFQPNCTDFSVQSSTNEFSKNTKARNTPSKLQKSTIQLLSKKSALPDICKSGQKSNSLIIIEHKKLPLRNAKLPHPINPGSAQGVSKKLKASNSEQVIRNHPTTRDHKANLDNILQTIDSGYINNYLDSAFEPMQTEKSSKPKLSKEEKAKKRKKVRIRYITNKIEEMKKKRTFLTSLNAVVEQEPDSPIEDVKEEEIDSEEERNNLLKEVLDTQQQVRTGYSYLDNIRKMIRQTGENINHHMDTVGDLKIDLEYMNQRGQNFDHCLKEKKFDSMKQFVHHPKPVKTKHNSNSLKVLEQACRQGIVIGNGRVRKEMEDMKRRSDLGNDDKVQIVNTLLGINGSMREFSQDLEFKLSRAFKGQAGKKYGMDKAQMSKYSRKLAFEKEEYDAIAQDAKRFLSKVKSEL